MARFGDDFDREAFIAAYDTPDPASIEAVTALEGELSHIVNWLKQIAEFGYHELVRLGRIPKSEGSMLDGLVEGDVLTATDRDDLNVLVALRNRLQHDYPEVTPKQIHSAVIGVVDLLPRLVGRYERMLKVIDG
jgi:uncharacterized protein YutE (UPF0331/DUF86 family)